MSLLCGRQSITWWHWSHTFRSGAILKTLFLKEVLHEMCFWEIVGSRNAVSFNTKCVSIFGQISSANGRVQDEIHAQSMWDHRSLTVFCIPRTLDILCVAAITPDGRIRIVFCNARLFSASWCGVPFRGTCYAFDPLLFFWRKSHTRNVFLRGSQSTGGWWLVVSRCGLRCCVPLLRRRQG